MGSSGSKQPSPPPTPTPTPTTTIRQFIPPTNPELDTPWRKFDWGKPKLENLKQKLKNTSVSHKDVKKINILVAGQIGAGKSSFINSIESALNGAICSRALVNSAAGESRSFTKKLKGFTIKCDGKHLPFVFKDVMGLEPGNLAGSQTDDIINIVFGHVKNGYEFNQEQPMHFKNKEFKLQPTRSEQCYCLVYVIDGSTVQFTDDKLIAKIKQIREKISEKGISQVVVMTKIDEACPLVKNDITKVYKSKKIKEKMEMCSIKVGVPKMNIFPVKNYHEEIETDDDIDILILKALEQIMHLAKDNLEDSDSESDSD